jgi:hypothetical protein
MSKRTGNFNWVQSIYDLALDESTTMSGILESANLDPLAGDLADVDFSGLDLSNQDMSGWDLSNAKLKDTKLNGAQLTGATVEPANLLEAFDWKEAELDQSLRALALEVEAMIGADPPFNPGFLHRVGELELSPRVEELLRAENLVFIGDLVLKSEAEALRIHGFGRKALNEVKEVLAQMGLHLGMEIPNWPPNDIGRLADAVRRAEE